MGACQALWLNASLEELKLKLEGIMTLMVDNKSTINLAKNLVAHGRSKHIETMFHFLRDQVSKGKLQLEFCKSQDQFVDALNKSLKKDKFEKLRTELGLRCVDGLN